MSCPVKLYIPDPLMRRVISGLATRFGLNFTLVEGGADIDVISTPVRAGQLLQKMRRAAGVCRDPLQVGDCLFIPDELSLRKADGSVTPLTEKERDILVCLLGAQGAVVSRRDLLTKIWGYVDGVETHTIETHIYRLRQKIETDPAAPQILLTEEQGYRLRD